jgi:glutamyl-tRNA(Gln) amidotransferase subunit E
MIHSDIRDYGLDPCQWRSLSKQLRADSGDALVVVWAPEPDAPTAIGELFLRAQDALLGVPAETRQAFRDGTNGFERILPGPDRMYPDTDTPPIPISDSLIAEVKSGIPETPWDREERYQKLGLNASAARDLARSRWADLYDALEPESGRVAVRLANAFKKRLPHWNRQTGRTALPAPEAISPLVRALAVIEIRLEATEQILDALLRKGEDESSREIMARYRRGPDDDEALAAGLDEVVAKAAELPGRSLETLERWGMGVLMRHFLGKLDPKQVSERLKDALGEVVKGDYS